MIVGLLGQAWCSPCQVANARFALSIASRVCATFTSSTRTHRLPGRQIVEIVSTPRDGPNLLTIDAACLTKQLQILKRRNGDFAYFGVALRMILSPDGQDRRHGKSVYQQSPG